MLQLLTYSVLPDSEILYPKHVVAVTAASFGLSPLIVSSVLDVDVNFSELSA